MSISNTLPADFLVIPSLANFARRLALPLAKPLAPRQSAGLSFADITDASLRATTKNALHVRRKPALA